MANEVAIIELFGHPKGRPIRYTVADGTGIAKGALLVVTDPRTAVAHTTGTTAFVGVAASEKVASDGQVSLAAYTDGIFDITAAAAGVTTVGYMVALSATANMSTLAVEADTVTGGIIGQVLESQANDERSAIRINK